MMVLRFGPSQPPGAFLPDALFPLLLFPIRLIRHDGMAIATIAVSCQGQAQWMHSIRFVALFPEADQVTFHILIYLAHDFGLKHAKARQLILQPCSLRITSCK